MEVSISFSGRHFSGKPFTTRGIRCSAMGAIPVHTFTSFKKDKEDTGEMSKRNVKISTN